MGHTRFGTKSFHRAEGPGGTKRPGLEVREHHRQGPRGTPGQDGGLPEPGRSGHSRVSNSKRRRKESKTAAFRRGPPGALPDHKFGPTKGQITYEGDAEKIAKGFFGKNVKAGQIAALAGAPDESTVKIQEGAKSGLNIHVEHPAFEYPQVRSVVPLEKGGVKIVNHKVGLKQEYQAGRHPDPKYQHMGTQILGRQVENAHASVSSISKLRPTAIVSTGTSKAGRSGPDIMPGRAWGSMVQSPGRPWAPSRRSGLPPEIARPRTSAKS